MDFERLVDLYYGPLYRFALSLTRTEVDACDLTQETFRTWALRGHQLRDLSKVKGWLFTTLYRQFLKGRRRETRFESVDLEEASADLPHVDPADAGSLDGDTLIALLEQVDEPYRAPLALFYLEDYPYQEIAGILNVPLGTVKSRIARGLIQLRGLLAREIRQGRSARGESS